MALLASFTVLGRAVPQGSWDPKGWDKQGRPRVVQANRESLLAWRYSIRAAIAQQVNRVPTELITGPVAVRAIFHVNKPKSVPKSRAFPIVAPDLDKTCRSLGDSMEKVLIANDSQVVCWIAWKLYTDGPSKLVVEVWEPDALVVSRSNPFAEQLPFTDPLTPKH